MSGFQIRPARAGELPDLAVRIASWNRYPETRCLHLGEEPGGVLAEMTAYTEAPAVVLAADTAGDVVGLLGADHLAEERRAWLWGPYARESEFDAVCPELLDGLWALLPDDLAMVDSFLEEENRRGREALVANGFEERGRAYVYTADRVVPGRSASDMPIRAQARHRESLAMLHESSFEAPHRTAAELIGGSERDRTWVAAEGDRVTGYVHVGPGEGGDEGYVHFLAVAPDRRGRGLGRELLTTAVRWLLGEGGFSRVGLTVTEDRIHARSLYQRAGFELKYTGVSARYRPSGS